MNAQEFIDECNSCQNAQRAAELLRIAVDIAKDHERISKIAYRLKERIEQEREQSKTAISQYEEQVKRLSEQVEDLSAELEDKRIELSQLSSLDNYIRRLGGDTIRTKEVVDKLCTVADMLSNAVISRPITLESNINEVTVSLADLQEDEKQVRRSAESILKVERTAKKSQQDKPKKISKAALEKSFNKFWAEYPKKVDKKRAQAIWSKLSPDNELVDKMIAAVKAQKKSEQWVKDNGQFIPYPSVWLNGERWNDEVAAPAVSAESDGGGHSYDLDKLLDHAKKRFNGSDEK